MLFRPYTQSIRPKVGQRVSRSCGRGAHSHTIFGDIIELKELGPDTMCLVKFQNGPNAIWYPSWQLRVKRSAARPGVTGF